MYDTEKVKRLREITDSDEIYDSCDEDLIAWYYECAERILNTIRLKMKEQGYSLNNKSA